MIDRTEPLPANPNPRVPTNAPRSGELERPLLRRTIDCAPTAETPLDRRIAARGGRRHQDARVKAVRSWVSRSEQP